MKTQLTITLVTGSLVALLTTALPARAFTIIDDFEHGPASVVAVDDTVLATVPVSSSGGGHVITSERKFKLAPHGTQGGILAASVSAPHSYDDYLLAQSSNGLGTVQVEWDWAGTKDLTQGGGVDTLQLDFSAVPAVVGGFVFIAFSDSNTSQAQIPHFPTAGTYKFPFSNWNAIDFTQATRCYLIFTFNGSSGESENYVLQDIRTIGQERIIPNFLGSFGLVETNPLPSPPYTFRTVHPAGPSLYKTEVGWQDIQTGAAIPALHGAWDASPLGSGESCAITMTTDVDGGYIYDWHGLYEFYVNFVGVSGRTVEIAYPPDPIAPSMGMTSIALPIHVLTYDAKGVQDGDSRILMTIDLMDGQLVDMGNPFVTPVFSKNATTLTGFRVSFEFYPLDVIQDSGPVLQVTWSSDWETIDVTTDVTAGSAEAGANGTRPPVNGPLFATPSVTRASTEIRALRPFETNETVHVYDVRGRLVRALLAAPGTSVIPWDGRDARGAQTSPGVYFARRTADDTAAARIVKIR
ncbi:MAG: hypothetical protein HKN20_01320 [Gemmatimonadetes bacterium]|nr:hypothetical protein [Gemmatimonadota bacterium]